MEPKTNRSASRFAGRPFSSTMAEDDMDSISLRLHGAQVKFLVFFATLLCSAYPVGNRPRPVLAGIDAQTVDESTSGFGYPKLSTGFGKTQSPQFVLHQF